MGFPSVAEPPQGTVAWHQVNRYRAAAHLATRLYPPPIAALIQRELTVWCEWGFRVGGADVVRPLYEQVIADAQTQGLKPAPVQRPPLTGRPGLRPPAPPRT